MTLKDFRLSQGMSQENFAREIGYTLSMYAKVENGSAEASTKFIKKVKKRYPKIDVNDIFFSPKPQQNC